MPDFSPLFPDLPGEDPTFNQSCEGSEVEPSSSSRYVSPQPGEVTSVHPGSPDPGHANDTSRVEDSCRRPYGECTRCLMSCRPPLKYRGRATKGFLEEFERFAFAISMPKDRHLDYLSKYVSKRLRVALNNLFTERDDWSRVRQYLLATEYFDEGAAYARRYRAFRELVRKKPSSKKLVPTLIQFGAVAELLPTVSSDEKIRLLCRAIPSWFMRHAYCQSIAPEPQFGDIFPRVLHYARIQTRFLGVLRSGDSDSSSDSGTGSDSDSDSQSDSDSDSDESESEDSDYDDRSSRRSRAKEPRGVRVQHQGTSTESTAKSPSVRVHQGTSTNSTPDGRA
ncbi:hypothetical protein H4R33_004804 [Dimargaris cristalligena]|uniref:Uncharacterized protein n=1 Tax=Dimargaris cristalligena TaxID=215637 RepID=A0A4P9ZWF3_9FUNG|nr:hypothetical protein H4R33_004804 [Dimargaris cristalligena]RKP37291.1 hypothetical protein BJ085DRAFT_40825 [Dimargaris cristalligena]|eukprot:RKP37291.1 hypothetical protein BJ085DRAFT_40825 [Dimargaris cristalligena]